MSSSKYTLAKHLFTDRLTLELFDLSDSHYECLIGCINSPTALADLGDFGIRTQADYDALRTSVQLPQVEPADFIYLIRIGDKNGPLAGSVTLAQRGESAIPDLGWGMLEEYMGCGYATEAAKELLRFARDDVGIKKIIAWPNYTNAKSIRVAEKIGFVRGGYAKESDGALAVIYKLPGMEIEENLSLDFWGRAADKH